jgi:hypothetical protein
MTDFIRPQGRRTIRRADPVVVHNPMVPATTGRTNRPIRMWDIGDGQPGSTKEKLRQVYLGALDAVDRVGTRKAEALKSGKFTSAGANDDTLQFALIELTPAFRRGRNIIDKAKREAQELRGKIRLQPTDKTDVVGALRRREVREFLKAMPPKERNAYISKRRENMDPDLALAIVEMPAEFSGVLEMDRNGLVDAALQAQHGEAMQQLVELERAIEVTESAVETGRDEVRQETGLGAEDFDKRAVSFEGKGNHIPWLKRLTPDGEVKILDLKTNTYRSATPEQIEAGQFFKDREEYRKANPVDD